jgi:hypothetical protein
MCIPRNHNGLGLNPNSANKQTNYEDKSSLIGID